MAGAAVGDVVAVDGGDDDVIEPHLRGGLREPQRLERVDGLRGGARVDVAVAAGTGASVSEDLERGRAAAPALRDVRAARLLADRDEARAAEQLLDLEVAPVRTRRPDLHPFGAARPLGDRKRALHAPESRGALRPDRLCTAGEPLRLPYGRGAILGPMQRLGTILAVV